MKNMLKIRIIVTLLPLLLATFIVPSATFAASVSLKGTAEVVNTGNSLLFESNNSAVTVDTETGNLSGFVWSEDLGWIDFDNNSGANSAKINLETGVVSGLAYVVNTASIVDFTNFNSNVIVNLETGVFTGFAWSVELGWIDFSTVNTGGVKLVLDENFVNITTIDSETAPVDGVWKVTNKKPVLSGITAPNAVVTITLTRDGTSVDVEVIADAEGKWSWTPTSDLVLGAYTVRIVSENADGVISETTFTLNIMISDLASSGLSNPYVMIVLTIVGVLVVVFSAKKKVVTM